MKALQLLTIGSSLIGAQSLINNQPLSNYKNYNTASTLHPRTNNGFSSMELPAQGLTRISALEASNQSPNSSRIHSVQRFNTALSAHRPCPLQTAANKAKQSNEQLQQAKSDPKYVKKNTINVQWLFDLNRFSHINKKQSIRAGLKDGTWPEKVIDPSDLGPYDVKSEFLGVTLDSSGRSIAGQAFYPDPKQTQDASSPLVVVIPPGFIGGVSLPEGKLFFDIQLYESYMKHMASYGFTVFGVYEPSNIFINIQDKLDHATQAKDISSLLDALTANDSPIKNRIDENKIALMGHSKGGKLAYLTAADDKRVGAIIAIDPVNQGGPPSFISKEAYDHPAAPIPGKVTDSPLDRVEAASLLFRAPPDLVNSESQFNAEHFWPKFKADGIMVDIDMKHADPLFDRNVQKGICATTAAWLLRHFSDQTQLDKYLQPNAIAQSFSGVKINRVEEKHASLGTPKRLD